MAANAGDQNTDKRNKCQRLLHQNRLLVLLICLIAFGVLVGTLLLFLIPALLKKEPRPYRLPTDIVPYEYGLEIKPYLTPGNFWFEGQVEIYVTCVRNTDLIVLHSKNLTINEDSIQVTNLDGDGFKVLLVSYDTANDLLVLRLLDDLKKRRQYRIYMKYNAPLSQGRSGFIISTFEDNENITHYIASTHFEPVSARSTFPCFDEPQFKSTFNITLVRWKNMTSLSNMPRRRKEYRGKNWEADIFEKSMTMSTYLVAFVFCDYAYTTKGKVTIWSPKHRRDNAEYAMNVSYKSLQFFETKLEMQYPGPKLDMVPIPNWNMAMENWGLIMYGFDYLLTPENKSEETADTFIQIAATVAHEIAHQWFGNLVTMKWWSDLWLNEGITTYMEHLATAELLPDWHQIDTTIAKVYETTTDDCSQSEPVWRPVYSSKDARRNFGGGTYTKGGMVTRMAHQILGDDVFWKGMKRYLNVNAYENVEEVDLWRSLTLAQTSGKVRLDMAEVMHSWTHVSGIPVVTVTRDYKRRTANISQKSCKSDDKIYEKDLWNIPILIESKYDIDLFDTITWLKTRNMTIEGMPGEHEWIIVNGDSTGYYIVNYDRGNWNLLAKQLILNHKLFEPTQRFKLLAEIKFLVMMEYAEIDLLFECLRYITEEKEIKILSNHFEFLHMYSNHFDEEHYNALMREFITHLWKNIYDRYGWVEKDSTKLLRWEETEISYATTSTLCDLEYGPCVDEALNRYSTLRKNKTTIGRGNVYNLVALCTGLLNATFEEWNDIKDTQFSDVHGNLLFALKCCKDESIIRQELYINIEITKGSALDWLISPVSMRKISFNEILNFVDKHFDAVTKKGFEVWGWKKRWINNGMAISSIRQVIQMISRHLKDMSGSNKKNVLTFLEYLKERLPVLEKKTRILKNWLDRKPWRQTL